MAAGTPATAGLAAKAADLRGRHRPGRPLVLPNAWDVASARAVAAAGFPAVATSSAAVVAALGFPDGQQGTLVADAVFAALARLAAAVDVPVTADLEAGYGLAPDELVDRLLAAGAVGCNLEDTDHTPGAAVPLVPAERHAEYVAAVKAAGRRAGVDVVVNARVDVHVRRFGEPEARTAESVARARAYRAAGADCAYPILLEEPEALRAIVAAVDGAVNVMVRDGGLGLAEAAALGVARASFGGGLFRVAQAALTERLEAIRETAAALEGGPLT
jgi:2-methylisocitrate lyase-like PEP mutase family enzyme